MRSLCFQLVRSSVCVGMCVASLEDWHSSALTIGTSQKQPASVKRGKIIIIIKDVYIAQVRKGHKCAMSAEISNRLTGWMYVCNFLSFAGMSAYCYCTLLLLNVTCHHTHTHTGFVALCPGLPGWAGTRKVIPVWILLKQETVSDSGISGAICKYAPRFRQITIPAPHHSVFFTGRMPFLSPSEQRQSTEGTTQSYCSSCHQKGHLGSWTLLQLYISFVNWPQGGAD